MHFDSDTSYLLFSEARQLPVHFDYESYIDTERELWALFPEADGRRVNFLQTGLTAWIYASVPESWEPLEDGETYILMPSLGSNGRAYMRPVRMKAVRRLTLSEYRRAHFTAIKLINGMNDAEELMRDIGTQILGPEVILEAQDRMRNPQNYA